MVIQLLYAGIQKKPDSYKNYQALIFGGMDGPSFVKNIKGPMPWSKIMVTGGVEPTDENLSAWFRAGVTCVGMGSNLFPAEVLKNGEWNKITELCRESLSIVKKYSK